jgi:hypothetical protein
MIEISRRNSYNGKIVTTPGLDHFGGFMRRWLAILAILISLILFSLQPGYAQSNISIQTLQVELWPEYDQPGVLVIYRITLDPQVKLPSDITLRIPKSVQTPHALAEQTANGLFNVNYTPIDIDDNWTGLKFTTTLPQVQLEYYDPTLVKKGSTHTFTFHWPGDYAVQDMTIRVQQPRTATNMQVQPNTGYSGPGNDGLTYFTIPVGSVDSGGTFKLDFSYDKSDDTLTQPATFESVTPAAPLDQTTLGRVSFSEVIPWTLGGVGFILIFAGVVWYIRSGRQPDAQDRRRRRSSQAAAYVEPTANDLVFCHQCGKRSNPGDVYCRSCGTKLHK